MNQPSFEFVLNEARNLSLLEQQQLVDCLQKEIREESLAIVEKHTAVSKISTAKP